MGPTFFKKNYMYTFCIIVPPDMELSTCDWQIWHAHTNANPDKSRWTYPEESDKETQPGVLMFGLHARFGRDIPHIQRSSQIRNIEYDHIT